MNHAADTDVIILGGGLAALCLAIQLKQRDPAIAVTVLERRDGQWKIVHLHWSAHPHRE